MDLITSQLRAWLSEYCCHCLLAQLHAILLSVSQGLGAWTPHCPDPLISWFLIRGWHRRPRPELRKQEEERTPYFPFCPGRGSHGASHSSQVQVTVMVAQCGNSGRRQLPAQHQQQRVYQNRRDRGFQDPEPPVGLLASVIPAPRGPQPGSGSPGSTALRGAGRHLFPFRSRDLRDSQLPVVLMIRVASFPLCPFSPCNTCTNNSLCSRLKVGNI